MSPTRLKADTPLDVTVVLMCGLCVMWRQAADGRQHISQQWCPQFTVRLRRDGFGGYQDLWLNRKVRIVCIVLAIVWGTMGLYYDDDDVIIMLSNVRVRKMSPVISHKWCHSSGPVTRERSIVTTTGVCSFVRQYNFV